MKKMVQVAEALAAGEPINDVAARFGIKPHSAYVYRHRCGMAEHKRDRLKDEVPQMYRDGLSVNTISKLARMDLKGVRSRIRAAGLTPKDRGINTVEFWRGQLAKAKRAG